MIAADWTYASELVKKSLTRLLFNNKLTLLEGVDGMGKMGVGVPGVIDLGTIRQYSGCMKRLVAPARLLEPENVNWHRLTVGG
jgi:hypothetical protein